MVVGRESQYICPFRYLLGLRIRKVSKNVVTSVLALSPLVSKARPTLVSLRDLILIFRRASLSLSAMDPGLQIRGEPVHPDREIRGGPSLKKMFFQSFGPQSGMKIMGGGPPGPLPWICHGLLYGSPPPPGRNLPVTNFSGDKNPTNKNPEKYTRRLASIENLSLHAMSK